MAILQDAPSEASSMPGWRLRTGAGRGWASTEEDESCLRAGGGGLRGLYLLPPPFCKHKEKGAWGIETQIHL